MLLTFYGVSHDLRAQSAKTKLQVIVIDESGNNVSNADIIIYTSEKDFLNKENKLVKGKTDKKGRFQFKGLESKSYFLEVKKDHKNNNTDNPETGLLSADRLNKIIVVIK